MTKQKLGALLSYDRDLDKDQLADSPFAERSEIFGAYKLSGEEGLWRKALDKEEDVTVAIDLTWRQPRRFVKLTDEECRLAFEAHVDGDPPPFGPYKGIGRSEFAEIKMQAAMSQIIGGGVPDGEVQDRPGSEGVNTRWVSGAVRRAGDSEGTT